jgi:hypothetical protein
VGHGWGEAARVVDMNEADHGPCFVATCFWILQLWVKMMLHVLDDVDLKLLQHKGQGTLSLVFRCGAVPLLVVICSTSSSKVSNIN